MRPARLLAFLLLLAVSFPLGFAAQAQTTEAEIFARLHDQSIFLRGLYVDDKLKFGATGQPEKPYKTGSFTVCGFRADRIRISGDRLRLEGVRVGLRFDEHGTPHRTVLTEGGLQGKDEQVVIEIDNGGQTDFTHVLDLVFANGVAELAPSLPEMWQTFLRKGNATEGLPPPARRNPCAVSERTGPDPNFPADSTPCPSQAASAHGGGPVQQPRLLRSIDPEFSEAARRAKFSGNVEVSLTVDTNGQPTHIHLVRPVGLGLDEKAVAAVSQYQFKPATWNGEPVKVDLYVEVNFQIF